MQTTTSLGALLGLILATTPASAGSFVLEIAAPDADRQNAIVRVPAPMGLPAVGGFTGGVAFQKSGGEAVILVPRIGKGEKLRLPLDAKAAPAHSGAVAELKGGRIIISSGGKRVFEYQGEKTALPRVDIAPAFRRGGYIHPLLSPGGRQITDDYPPNHIHHHGIWFPWTKTKFDGREPDFWNMGEQKGTIEFQGFGEHWSGPVHAGMFARHKFIDLTSGEPRPVLDEVWEITVYNVIQGGHPAWIFDLVSTQECATPKPLDLPQYYYGGMGLRGNWAWNGPDKCFFLTSNGESNREKANETRANWCHMGGLLEGEFTGAAVLCHPDNFRAPQPLRVHPREPFFCWAPSQMGDWAIIPGKPYVSRYRYVVFDGKPDRARLDQLWQDYAQPLQARILAE